MEQNQYTFDVCVDLTKRQIKNLIQQLYGVEILSINTHRPSRNQRRGAKFVGYQSNQKRAIITLKKGQILKLVNE